MSNNSKFGKNGWKITAFYAGCVVAVILIAAAGVFAGYPKITKMYEEYKTAKAEEDAAEDAGQTFGTGTAIADGNNQGEDSQDTSQKSAVETRKATLLEGIPDAPMETYTNIPVIAASATSTIVQQGTSNEPILVFDGSADTNWQEGAAGYGIGESVSFSFDKTYKVKYISFMLGNWKTDDYFIGNGRPKTLNLLLGDFTQSVTFRDGKDIQWVEFNTPITADSMKVTIEDVYAGTKWEDTCITEITLFGD